MYASIRDLTALVNTKDRKRDLERVGDGALRQGRVIGFVTQDNATLSGLDGGGELVAVYLPMSYQIGG